MYSYRKEKMESVTSIIDYLNFRNIKWMPIMLCIDPETNKKIFLPGQNQSVLGFKLDNDFKTVSETELKRRQSLLHLTEYIEIDTDEISHLDIDDPNFDCSELKERFPYFESITKKLPHFFMYLKNKDSYPKQVYSFNGNKKLEVLKGRWSLCHKETKVFNSDEPIQEMSDEPIKENEIKDIKVKKYIQEEKGTKAFSKEISKLIDIIKPEYSDNYDTWFKVGAALFNENYSIDEFDRFSKLSSSNYGGVEKQWEKFKKYPFTGIDTGIIHKYAMDSDIDKYMNITNEGDVLTMSDIRNLIDTYYETEQNAKKVISYANRLFNKILSVVEISRCEVIIKRKFDSGDKDFLRMGISNFFNCYTYFRYRLLFEGEKELSPPTDLVKCWYDSSHTRRYKDIFFYPKETVDTDTKNVFTGLKRKQSVVYNQEELRSLEQNELKYFINHIKSNLCYNDNEVFNYTINWLGCTVKHPEIKLKTCMVLNGPPGAGKGTIVDKIGECLGNKYISRPQSMESIAGSFGLGGLSESLVVFLDEAFWGGDKKLKGAIKKLVTEKNVTVEKKYLNTYNTEVFFNVILASNEDKVVNIDLNQRRFIVLNVELKEKSYYSDIVKTDPQVLYDYFCSKDYSGFEWVEVPTTKYTQEQQEHSLDSVAVFIQEYFLQEDRKDEMISKTALYDTYKRSTKFPEKVISFWKLMKRYLSGSIDYNNSIKLRIEDLDGKITRPRGIKVITDREGMVDDFKKNTKLTLIDM